MVKIVARAPTRIDLAGGTLDLWPIHQLLRRKATVNVAVTLAAETEISKSEDGFFHFISKDQQITFCGDFAAACSFQRLPLLAFCLEALWHAELPPITLRTTAKSPAGAGLGGSSCLAITVCAALRRARAHWDAEAPSWDEKQLVATAQDIEARLIEAPTGVQDYWAPIRGGVNVLRFNPGDTVVTTTPPSKLPGLNDRMILCYSGQTRASAINNWEIFKRVFDGDKDLLQKFAEIGATAEACAEEISRGNLDGVLKFSKQEWLLRCQLWPNIVTDATKRLEASATKAGADFSRVCGAGGGGVMTIFTPPTRRAEVIKALAEAGGTVLDSVAADQGLHLKVDL